MEFPRRIDLNRARQRKQLLSSFYRPPQKNPRTRRAGRKGGMRLALQLGPLAALLMASIGVGVAAGQEEAGWSDRVPKVAGARHYYVSPQGRPDNSGSRDAPWDLPSALAGRQKVAPGDVIWVRGGQYRGGTGKLLLGLAGKEGAPI